MITLFLKFQVQLIDNQVGSDRSRSAISYSDIYIYFSSKLINLTQDYTAAEPPHCCRIMKFTAEPLVLVRTECY